MLEYKQNKWKVKREKFDKSLAEEPADGNVVIQHYLINQKNQQQIEKEQKKNKNILEQDQSKREINLLKAGQIS